MNLFPRLLEQNRWPILLKKALFDFSITSAFFIIFETFLAYILYYVGIPTYKDF